MRLTANLKEDRFGNSLFDVLVTESTGEVIKRTLPLEDFVNLLADCTKIKKEKRPMIEVSKVPNNCLKLRQGEKPCDFDAAFFLKEEIVGAKILGNPMRFPQPRRVVFISHRGAESGTYGRTNLRVYAVKDKDITDTTKLFWYPLGHVGEDGHVCTGNAGAGVDLSSVDKSQDYFDAFFGAECSGHYYSKGGTIKEDMSYGEMMETLSGLSEFPYEWLQPSRCGSVSQAWSLFVGK